MKRFVFILTLLSFVGFNHLQAQGVEISGNVTSAEDGAALPGVSVVVQGTTIGAVTDFEGNYAITVPESATILMFSFVGMLTQEIAIAGQTIIDIVLESSTTELDEVVVTALGMRREQKTLGYSATQVGSEVLSKAGTNSAMSALQGKVAGVMINTNSGAPGASTKVIIRGYSSIGGIFSYI